MTEKPWPPKREAVLLHMWRGTSPFTAFGIAMDSEDLTHGVVTYHLPWLVDAGYVYRAKGSQRNILTLTEKGADKAKALSLTEETR